MMVLSLSSCLSAEGDLLPPGPRGVIWQAEIAETVELPELKDTLEKLLGRYEATAGVKLAPQDRGAVGLKVNTRSGLGLSTDRQLVKALIDRLEARGFQRDAIFIVDYSEHNLRSAGFLPQNRSLEHRFEGVPVIALEKGQHYDRDWFYESPIPPTRESGALRGLRRVDRPIFDEVDEARKSFLADLLLFEVDFWINLPVFVDDPAIGVDGALANATLWNVSNGRRFLANRSSAAAAIAEIAGIPEQRERMVLNLTTLWRFQYIGGPGFRSLYTRSEPLVWLSGDPVAMDRLVYDRMNFFRRLEGFPEISPIPAQIPFAASLGLGEAERRNIQVVDVLGD